jgi:hypothetical protein
MNLTNMFGSVRTENIPTDELNTALHSVSTACDALVFICRVWGWSCAARTGWGCCPT